MSDEDHAGMSLAEALLAKYGTGAAALAAIETMERSDVWVYVTFDADQLDVPVNATGFFPDEHAAFLAGAEYERQWQQDVPGEEGVVTKPIPLFIDKRRTTDAT